MAGAMSDRGYNSMTSEDANRISMIIGSVDSLDSAVRAPTTGGGNGMDTAAAAAAGEDTVSSDHSDDADGDHGELKKSEFIMYRCYSRKASL